MFGKKIVLTVCVSVFLIGLMFSAMTVSAQSTVGVKAGDWAGFGDISFDYASNVPGHEKPSQDMNISWVDMKVLDVSDDNVTVRSTTILTNGTEQTGTSRGNVTSGEGDLSIAIIPSNLGAGEEIPANLTWYTSEPLKLTINDTVTRNYANANREVNCVNITYPILYDTTPYGSWNMSFYWDKKTGILCEEMISYAVSMTVNSTEYYMNMTLLYRMTATNMWPALFPVEWDGHAFNVTMISNSTISDFIFSQADKEISFNVTGPAGKAGYCNVTIPKDLLRDNPWTILVNGTDQISLCTVTENGTHTFIYIPCTHSTNTIQIIGTWVVPEFPSAMILPLLMMATAIPLILCGRRRKT